MSRLLERIETWLVVTVIAVLVWLYAEGASVDSYSNQPVRVQFVPASAGEDLAIEPSEPFTVLMDYRSSNSQRREVERLVSEPIEYPVEFDPDSPESKMVVMAEVLRQSPVGAKGINILSVEPEVKQVTVEPIQTVTMQVTPEVVGLELEGPATVEPREVNVRLPARLAPLAEDRPLVARLDAGTLGPLEQDRQSFDGVKVPLELPPELKSKWSRIEAPSVSVGFTARKYSRRRTVRLPGVPVNVSVQPLLLRRYQLDMPEEQMVIPDVRLSGPAPVIERIANRELRVRAEIRPTADELARGVRSFMVHLELPEGVSVESPLPVIELRVRPLQAQPAVALPPR